MLFRRELASCGDVDCVRVFPQEYASIVVSESRASSLKLVFL